MVERLVTWDNDRLLLNRRDETVATGLMTHTDDATAEDCCCGADDGCYFIDDFMTTTLADEESIDGRTAQQLSPRIVCTDSTSVSNMLSNTWQVLTGDIIGDGGDGVVGGSNINKAVFDAAVVGEARNVGFLEVGFVMPHHEFPGGLPDAAGQYCSVFIPGYEIRIEWIAWDFSRPRVRVTVWDLDLTEPPNPIITYSPRTLNINGAVNIQVTVQDTQIQLESSAIAAPPTHGVIQCNIPVGKTETLWGIGGSLLMECTFVEWYCCDDQDDCPEGTAHHCDLQDSDLCTP